jgi:hypothetical protein
MDNVTIFTLIAAAGTVCGIVFGYIGYSKGSKKDSYKDGDEKGGIKADLQYMKRLMEDVLLEQKDTNKSINALSERVTRVEESTKQAHKRIDEFKKERGDE